MGAHRTVQVLCCIFLSLPLSSTAQSPANSSSSVPKTNPAINSNQTKTTALPVAAQEAPTRRTPRGCASELDTSFFFLCDMDTAWGIVVETLAALGFVVTVVLLVAVLFFACWQHLRLRPTKGMGGATASFVLFLMGTAGLFGLTFAFVVSLGPLTCPARVFLFGVLYALCFSALLSRGLALRGLVLVQGWGEAALTVALSIVQVVIAVEWLLIVRVRDQQPCYYSQGEFVLLITYVLCLLAVALCCSIHCLCHFGCPGGTRRPGQAQAVLLCLTLMLSVAIWVVWIALFTKGNWELGHRPLWDDPVLSVALVSNGWTLLLGHGLAQAALLCRGTKSGEESPLDFTGWTSRDGEMHGVGSTSKSGKDNRSFESDSHERKGKMKGPVLRSPYESGFSMVDIDPKKDYSIPRPQTTNTDTPYDDYYGRRLSN